MGFNEATLEAAKSAVRRGMTDRSYDDHAYDREVFEEGVADIADAALAAAYPHIRRAVIEELIGKAEARPLPKYARWLRAELEGDGS